MNNNELTLRIKGEMEQFRNNLKLKGYKEIEHFILYDTFLIPEMLEIGELDTRKIISKAVIIRKVEDITHNEIRRDALYKVKKFDDNGEIVEQKSTKLKVNDCHEAENFFKAIGYKKIMNITEKDFVYEKNGMRLATKDVENGDNMIEIETQEGNNKCDTIDKLKKWLIDENIDLDYSDFFVKKAEVELNKVLKRA